MALLDPAFSARKVETVIEFIREPPGLSRQKQGFEPLRGAIAKSTPYPFSARPRGLVSFNFLTSDHSRAPDGDKRQDRLS